MGVMSSGHDWFPSMDEIGRHIPSRPTSCSIVGISGYGGAGKSTLAQQLGMRLAAPVVSIDEFGTAAVFQRSTAWDGFDRARLVRQVLAPLRAGDRQVRYDRCDDWETWLTVSTPISVDRFLVLEGVGVFHPDLLPYLDYRVWIDIPLTEATRRGIAREAALGRAVRPLWEATWAPNERDFEARFHPRATADAIVRPVPRP